MKPAAKLDLLALHKADYVAPKRPVVLTVAPATYLAISGQGQPGDATFTAQIGALYAVAFTTKMQHKSAGRGDYTIAKLEARWPVLPEKRSDVWSWELLIRTPDFVTDLDLQNSVRTLLARKQPDIVREVRRLSLDEGRCVQMLHVGPYDQEPASMRQLIEFATASGLHPLHSLHEIYLSDPRRVPPERLRTILRVPLAPT